MDRAELLRRLEELRSNIDNMSYTSYCSCSGCCCGECFSYCYCNDTFAIDRYRVEDDLRAIIEDLKKV